jgi:hypothetical protein
MNFLETFNKDEILFKKVPFGVTKDISTKYKEFCDVFYDTYIAPVKLGNNSDILGKDYKKRCNNFRKYGWDYNPSRK